MFILALSSNFLKAFVICRISKHVLFHHPNYLWKCSSHPRQIIIENILSIWQWTTDNALWGQSIFFTLGHVSFFFLWLYLQRKPCWRQNMHHRSFFNKKGSTRWSWMVMQVLSCPTTWSHKGREKLDGQAKAEGIGTGDFPFHISFPLSPMGFRWPRLRQKNIFAS